jgi:hypothetical protein
MDSSLRWNDVLEGLHMFRNDVLEGLGVIGYCSDVLDSLKQHGFQPALE